MPNQEPSEDKDEKLPKYSKRCAEIVVSCYYAGLNKYFCDYQLRAIMMPIIQKELDSLSDLQYQKGYSDGKASK